MVEIICDTCGKKRPQPENIIKQPGWILGFDLEVENKAGLQRSLRFHDRWDDCRALELGAIHFCCEGCKDKYLRNSRAA